MTTDKSSDKSSHDADAAHDRAYKLGWMQAWREWSACVGGASRFHEAQVLKPDLERMEKRAREMENYDSAT